MIGVTEGFSSPHDDNWERLGESIGKNTQLSELTMTRVHIAKEDLEKFFHGIAHNRSIRTLSFRYSSLSGGELFNIMVPFFKNNLNFEWLKQDCCCLNHECRLPFVSALAKFDSLKELILTVKWTMMTKQEILSKHWLVI